MGAATSPDITLTNAPLMTARQQSMLNSLLAGYASMMKGTTFGSSYPGPVRSGYAPKTFNPGAMSGIIPGKPGSTGNGGWNWKKGGGGGGGGRNGGGGGGNGGGGGGGGQPEEGNKDRGPGSEGPGPIIPPPALTTKNTPIMNILAGQYTNPLVSPFLFTGNFPKRTMRY